MGNTKTKIRVIAIAAVGWGGIIGNNNTIPWKLRKDLNRFRGLTTGHVVIMGRKTYESIGKPLPNRMNVVISRSNIDIDGCTVCNTIEEAMVFCHREPGVEKVFIIGGSEIYNQTIHLWDEAFITWVSYAGDGDAYFPIMDYKTWTITSLVESHEIDNQNDHTFAFANYKRKAHYR